MYRAQSDNSDSSSGDSDSENEVGSWKRRATAASKEKMAEDPYDYSKFIPPHVNEQNQVVGSKKKKVNNIWGSVLQEQVLSEDLKGFTVEPNKLLISQDRSCENYDYTRKELDTRPDPDDEFFQNKDMEVENLPGEEQRKFRKRPIKERIGPKTYDKNKPRDIKVDEDSPIEEVTKAVADKLDEPKEEIIEEDRMKNGSEVETFPYNFKRQARKRSVKERLGERTFNKYKPRDIAVTEDNTEKEVAKAVARKLNESKEYLIERAVEILGTKKVLEILFITEDIEDSGGLMTFNGARRRTPGGVFFLMLKNDKNITKEQIYDIFKEDMKEQERQRKKKKAHRRKATADQNKMDVVQEADDPDVKDKEEGEEEEEEENNNLNDKADNDNSKDQNLSTSGDIPEELEEGEIID